MNDKDFNEDGLVICRLCKKPFKFITTRHLTKYHSIDTKEYRRIYPDVSLARKDFYKTIMSKKGTKRGKRIKKEIYLDESNQDCNLILEELNYNDPDVEELNYNDPDVEELNYEESDKSEELLLPKHNVVFSNKPFEESKSLSDLINKKIPIPSKNRDPMDDKIDIISYLKLSFPNVKNNYMFIKKNQSGNPEYQFITDIADPTAKIVFDFPNAFWHNDQLIVSITIRNQILKMYGWKIIEIGSPMPKVTHVESKLKDHKLI